MSRPSRSRQFRPTPATLGAGDLATQLFGRRPEHTLALLRAAWSVAVGPELARRTEVLALEGRTLRVRVPDAHWRKVLHRLRLEILRKLRETSGHLAPKALGFQEGQVSPLTAPRVPARAIAAHDGGPAPAIPAAVRDAAGQIADPELRALFTTAAARYLQTHAASREA
jgi:hypothetical protein